MIPEKDILENKRWWWFYNTEGHPDDYDVDVSDIESIKSQVDEVHHGSIPMEAIPDQSFSEWLDGVLASNIIVDKGWLVARIFSTVELSVLVTTRYLECDDPEAPQIGNEIHAILTKQGVEFQVTV